MEELDYCQFNELAEQQRGKISLKKLCEQEGVRYRKFISWRHRVGLSSKYKQCAAPMGLLELETIGVPQIPERIPKTTSIHIEFENGLKLDRGEMEVDHLIEFLTKIRGALCLD